MSKCPPLLTDCNTRPHIKAYSQMSCCARRKRAPSCWWAGVGQPAKSLAVCRWAVTGARLGSHLLQLSHVPHVVLGFALLFPVPRCDVTGSCEARSCPLEMRLGGSGEPECTRRSLGVALPSPAGQKSLSQLLTTATILEASEHTCISR